MKKLIISICTLALATALLGASTFAWFSMNKTVEVKGLQVTAQSDSSLVITKGAVPSATEGQIVADFQMSEAKALCDSTHDLAYGSGLKILTNAGEVDPITGKAASPQYANAVNNAGNNGKYYFIDDKFVGIAAAGQAMSSVDIKITLFNATNVGHEEDPLEEINGAISVDFYLCKLEDAAGTTIDGNKVAISEANYVGTLNLAHHKTGASASKTAFEDALIVRDGADKTAFTIPKAGAASDTTAIAVRMVIYVDGALEYLADSSNAGKTLIRSADAVSIASKSLKIKFEAVPHTTAPVE